MPDEFRPPEAGLSEVEAALGSLRPAGGRFDRDSTLFRAGQASARPRRSGGHHWRSVAAGLGLVALGEAVLLAQRTPPRVVERVVVIREPALAPAQAPPAPERVVGRDPAPEPAPPVRFSTFGRTAHERLTAQVIRYGLDGLPATPPAVGHDAGPWPAPSRRALQEELWNALNHGDAS